MRGLVERFRLQSARLLASVAMMVVAAFSMPSTASAQTNDSDATYEAYAAALSQLARLSNMQQRLGDRRWVGRVWVMPEASSIDVKPGSSTALTNYKVEDARLRAGVEFPISGEITGGFVSFGFNGWLGRSETDILVPNNGTQIDSDAYAVAMTASWFAPKGVYFDTQLQYATFNSDLSGQGGMQLASDHNADALSTSVETGYRFFFRNSELTSRAQLVWTDTGFKRFSDSNNDIDLEDGKTLSGLFGVFLDRRWKIETIGISGRLHAEVSARMPLDGETAVSIGGMNHSSEIEDTAFHFGFGSAYRANGYALFGSFSTEHSSEIEFYRVSLGASFGF